MSDLPVPLSPPPPDSPASLIDVRGVGAILSCSKRHVYRLSDLGAMPRPRKLGALVRWSRIEIEAWVKAGCPSCRSVKGGAR